MGIDEMIVKGGELLNSGRNAEAIKEFNTVISMNPALNIAWTLKGAALVNLGQYKEALEAVNKALSLNPVDAVT